MYLCNRLALCRCTSACGRFCITTKDKNYEMKPQAGQKIVVNCVEELNFFLKALRETEVEYRVEGFIIYFV